MTDAPKATVGGGSRGEAEGEPLICVLAPERLALTTREQPTLFWFIAGPTKRAIRLTLVELNGNAKPTVLRRELTEVARSGIQSLRLADHDVRLKPGVEYLFSVELMVAPGGGSGNPVGQTILKRADPSLELKAALENAAPEEHAAIYAENGVWYDALAALSDQVEANPALREDRAALLAQVGLKEAAAADRPGAERSPPRTTQRGK